PRFLHERHESGEALHVQQGLLYRGGRRVQLAFHPHLAHGTTHRTAPRLDGAIHHHLPAFLSPPPQETHPQPDPPPSPPPPRHPPPPGSLPLTTRSRTRAQARRPPLAPNTRSSTLNHHARAEAKGTRPRMSFSAQGLRA